MIARFNGNVVPFADDATLTNRTVFGGTTQSDAIDDNLNADFKKGWEIVGLNDNPTREDFNAMGYTLGALTAYLYEMGISEWNASQNYRVNSRVIGSDGKLYKALTGTIGSPNVGKNPTSDAVNWELEFKNFVTLTGNQTIDGVKTFSSSPIVPTPTNATDAANKAYVDTKANLASPAFTGTVTLPSTTSIGTVSSAELGYLDGVTSAIQAQINGKAATNQTMYIGTTAMAINRATAAQTLTGVSIDGNAATATKLTNSSGDWVASGASANVVGMLIWKNYGNGHVIFDASNGTSPSGVAINNTNPNNGWVTQFPTLMGWNGSQTYGVRVDAARYSESCTGNAATATYAGTASAFTTAVGSAPSYACRAWVNFNGTGTVAIRASGNVSSITDNGVGDYTINFTTAMLDANYSMSGGTQAMVANGSSEVVSFKDGIAPLAGSARILTHRSTVGNIDSTYATVTFFR